MFLFVLTVVAQLASAPPAPVVREAAREVLANDAIQRELPDQTSLAEASAKTLRRMQQRQPRLSRFRRALGGGILYTTIAVILSLVLLWLGRGLLGYAPDRPLGADDGPADPMGERDLVARPQADAEALARAGRYTEAAHTLLLETLKELTRRHGRALAPSLTSREILAAVDLPSAARQALGEIIEVVEVSHFGNTELGPDEYARCRTSHGRFADAIRGGRP